MHPLMLQSSNCALDTYHENALCQNVYMILGEMYFDKSNRKKCNMDKSGTSPGVNKNFERNNITVTKDTFWINKRDLNVVYNGILGGFNNSNAPVD